MKKVVFNGPCGPFGPFLGAFFSVIQRNTFNTSRNNIYICVNVG